MIKQPVRGMRDMLPKDVSLRQYLLNLIETIATNSGYEKIETPVMEHLENLTTKDGGENESLIFKVLKRGRDLERAMSDQTDLSDSALRYDLTVPLSRYYAAHSAELPTPFKSLQIGPVWRADAPQKGRYRQFIQCDMDIIGDASVLAEIDALTTILTILEKICAEANITGLTLHLNDRRILQSAVAYAGFAEQDYSSVLIALDKNDKIGLAGVERELIDRNLSPAAIAKFIALFQESTKDLTACNFCAKLAEKSPDESVLTDLETITSALPADQKVVFDPTLVRGMGYYTGPIFECTADGLGASIGGGGRYDRMIGKFSGAEVPACGFSIGFERLIAILDDLNFTPANLPAKKAILISKKVPKEQYGEIINRAKSERQSGEIVSVFPMARNLSHQIETLEQNGYNHFEKIYKD